MILQFLLMHGLTVFSAHYLIRFLGWEQFSSRAGGALPSSLVVGRLHFLAAVGRIPHFPTNCLPTGDSSQILVIGPLHLESPQWKICYVSNPSHFESLVTSVPDLQTQVSCNQIHPIQVIFLNCAVQDNLIIGVKSFIFTGCGHQGAGNPQDHLRILSATLANPQNIPGELLLTFSFPSTAQCRDPVEDSGLERWRGHQMEGALSPGMNSNTIHSPFSHFLALAWGVSRKQIIALDFEGVFVPADDLFQLMQKLLSNNPRIIL